MAIFKMLSTNTSLKRLQIVEKVFSFAFRDIIWHEKDMKQIQEWLQNNFTIESLGVPVSTSTILPILCYFLSDKTQHISFGFLDEILERNKKLKQEKRFKMTKKAV